MARPADITDFGSRVIAKQSFKPQTLADATALVGTTFDRIALNYPQSGLVLNNISYTTAAGDATGKQTVLCQLFHSDAADMSGETVFDSVSKVITWGSDAAKTALLALPLNLEGAKRYVRAKLTVTKSGTVTISAQTASQIFIFGGLAKTPGTAYRGAGYIESTDTAA